MGAQKHKWQEKRERYQARSSDAFITLHAERLADRSAEIEDKAIDVIDQVLDKFREDLDATKKVRQPDGSITEEPVWRMKPRDAAILIDRLMALFELPSSISQHKGLTVTSEVTPAALSEFIEATRGMGGPSRMDVSPLPRTSRQLDD